MLHERHRLRLGVRRLWKRAGVLGRTGDLGTGTRRRRGQSKSFYTQRRRLAARKQRDESEKNKYRASGGGGEYRGTLLRGS
eukprot:722733-Pleurochrysis_carterae.AAC.1